MLNCIFYYVGSKLELCYSAVLLRNNNGKKMRLCCCFIITLLCETMMMMVTVEERILLPRFIYCHLTPAHYVFFFDEYLYSIWLR